MKTSYLCTTEIEQDDRFGAFKKNAALFRIEPYFFNKYTNGIVRLESADKLQNERWVWQKKFYRIIVDGITLRLFPACFLFCCGTAFPCRLVIRDRPLRGVAGYNKWHSTTKERY